MSIYKMKIVSYFNNEPTSDPMMVLLERGGGDFKQYPRNFYPNLLFFA